MLSRRAIFALPLVAAAAVRAPALAAAARGKMQLCMHTNTSNNVGYRRAMEGWAKAGIKYVELNGAFVDEFLKTESLATARKVLDDNGLTAVHGAVGVGGLLEPNPERAAALDKLKRRIEMFTTLGIKRCYTTSGTSQKVTIDDFKAISANMHEIGELAKGMGDMKVSVEFLRISPYMATLPTALRLVRDAAHPNFGVLFDFYHFWSGNSRLEDMDLLRPNDIFHVHFQDVPDMPREMLDMFSRNIPGDGISPLNAILTKLARVGYNGPLSVELFLPRLTMGDPEAVAREVREKAEPVMKKAGVL